MDIYQAIEAGDTARALAMIDAEPDLATVRNTDGVTPIMHAMYQHQFALAGDLAERVGERIDIAEAAALDNAGRVRALIDAGTDADGRTPDGFTPLQLAAYFGAPATTAVLIEAGADVSAVSDNPMRIQPLHAAAAGRHGDVATRLIAAGADVDAAQRHGWTPLHSAAHNGDTALVDALLAAGARRTARNDDGDSAASVAEKAGHDEIAGRLQ